jgi:hypothetical protein
MQFGYWCAVDVYALYQARYPPLCRMLPQLLRPAPVNNGAVGAVVFFYQMATLATHGGWGGVLGKNVEGALDYLGKLVSLQQPPGYDSDSDSSGSASGASSSSSSSSCMFVGMDARDAMVIALVSPLMLLVLLPVVSTCVSLCDQLRARVRLNAASQILLQFLLAQLQQQVWLQQQMWQV